MEGWKEERRKGGKEGRKEGKEKRKRDGARKRGRYGEWEVGMEVGNEGGIQYEINVGINKVRKNTVIKE